MALSRTKQTQLFSVIQRGLGAGHLIGLLPILAVAIYWINPDWVLFVISFILPLVLLFQGHVTSETNTPTIADAPENRDYLTGLYNRSYVMKTIENHLISDTGQPRETAVLHIDLDQFRRINDRFGQEAGDQVLITAGDRIKSCVRANDLVARIAGDDFAIVLFPQRKIDKAVILSIAERVHQVLSKAFTIDHNPCYLSCSVGVCLSGRAPDTTAQSILTSAEIALDLAKKEGPGATRSFSPKMRSVARNLTSLAADLEAALNNGQIQSYFQPQISTDTGKITGFEALARWQHPSSGVILPGTFLQAIETAGQMERLGEVILYQSLTALKAWDRAGLKIAAVGVNFSSQQLRNPKLVEKIKWDVDRFDLSPDRITIEVLENVISDHQDDTITRNIRALAAQGFSIDLDDFGTGHASISNIQRFAVNRIKIDRSFVTNIDSDIGQQKITSAIINMAESLGLETIAEGVETIAEQAMLAQLGCRNIQGFSLARPMPFEDTIAWITAHNGKLDPRQFFDRRTG